MGRWLVNPCPALFNIMAGVAWIVLIANDLRAYLMDPQWNVLQTVVLGSGQQNPFTEIMPAVVTRIRAEIQGCHTNQVSLTPNAIPPSLKSEACYLILEEMATRIPSLIFTPMQMKMADEARKYLARISTCDVPIEIPLDPLKPPDVQVNSAVEIVTSSTRLFTTDKMQGL